MKRTLAVVAAGTLALSLIGIASAAALQPAPWSPRPAADYQFLALPSLPTVAFAHDAVPPPDPTQPPAPSADPTNPRSKNLSERVDAVAQQSTVTIATPTPRPVARPIAVAPKPVLPPPAPAVPTVADAKAYALAQVGSTQYSCLYSLWQKESRWNPYARNASSGAYGIPQALPGSKMGIIASDWRTNPITQVKWGLRYIASTYGTPCAAWAHSQSYGWY